MAVKFLDPGGDADFLIGTTNGHWNNSNSAVVASDFVVSIPSVGAHQKSLSLPVAAAASCYISSDDGAITPAGTRISFRLYIVALPTGTKGIMAYTGAAGGTTRISIKLTSAGVLQLWNGDTTAQIGSNGSTLATGQWYRISFATVLTSTTVNQFRLFVEGNLDISVSNASIASTSVSDLVFGNKSVSGDATFNFRVSDIYADDSTALTDPGNIYVTAKRPFANGSLNEWTTQIGAGGSGYGSGHAPQVNERALSTTNGWSITNAAKKTEEYSIEGITAGDFNLTGAAILDFLGWVSAKVASASTGNIIVAGVATNISVTTSFTYFEKVAGSQTYPAGNTDIGMDTNTVNQLFSLAECGIIIAFIPPVNSSLSDTQAMDDSITVAIDIPLSLSDTQGMDDSVSVGIDLPQNLSDTQAMDDSLTTQIALPVPLSDTEAMDDSLNLVVSLPVPMSDTMAMDDSLILTVSIALTLTDTMGMNDDLLLSIPPAPPAPGRKLPLAKDYVHKIYDPSGTTLIETVSPKEITSNVSFRVEINSGYGQYVMKLNRKFDDFGYSNLTDMNIVKIFEYDTRFRHSRLIYEGYISELEPYFEGSGEGVDVVLLGLGSLLTLAKYKNGASYVVSYTATDPAQMARNIIDHHRSVNPNSPIHYTSNSIPLTAITADNDFTERTHMEALADCKDLLGDDYFFRVEVDGLVTMMLKPSSATHKFIIGKHIQQLRLNRTNETVINQVRLKYGSSGTQDYDDVASRLIFGVREKIFSKTDIPNGSSAVALVAAQKEVNDNKLAKYTVKAFDVNNAYDFEIIKVGETIKVMNLKDASFMGNNMQIHAFVYSAETFSIELDQIRSFVAELKRFNLSF